MRFALAISMFASPLWADAPVVTAVQVSDGRFDVTLSHPDTGWDHYADGWEVVDGQGNRLGIRELAHPHVNEQPFTRSLSGVVIPDGVTEVFVRGRCNVHGWSEDLTPVAIR